MRPLRIGSRGSTLAVAQTEIVAAALHAAAPKIETDIVLIHTEGDRRSDESLAGIGGQGVFVKEIEAALLRGEIDLAVHSLKDMPASLPDGLTIGAVLRRGDVRDALVSRGGHPLADLPAGASIGTDSRRRSAQLLALRNDLKPTPVRGNVDTRVRKAETGEVDAVVLAAAGLERLGLLGRASQVFTVAEILPAVGQGVLAVETRRDDGEALELLAAVDDAPTRVAATAERSYLQRLGAGCRLPVAAYAEVDDGRVRLRVLIADDGGRLYKAEGVAAVSEADSLGRDLAEGLLVAVDSGVRR